MPLSTEAEKKSALAISHYSMAPVVATGGTLDQFRKQVIGYGFGGITAEAPSTAGILALERGLLRGVGRGVDDYL